MASSCFLIHAIYISCFFLYVCVCAVLVCTFCHINFLSPVSFLFVGCSSTLIYMHCPSSSSSSYIKLLSSFYMHAYTLFLFYLFLLINTLADFCSRLLFLAFLLPYFFLPLFLLLLFLSLSLCVCLYVLSNFSPSHLPGLFTPSHHVCVCLCIVLSLSRPL